MAISALPIGLVIALQQHYEFHADWHWSIIQPGVMTVTIGALGGLFLFLSTFIFRRRGKRASDTSK